MAGGNDVVLGAMQQKALSFDRTRVTAPRKGIGDVVIDLAIRPRVESRFSHLPQPSPGTLENLQIGGSELGVVGERGAQRRPYLRPRSNRGAGRDT
jgi:hypothetical protein